VLANDVTMRGGLPKPVPTDAHDTAYSTLHDSDQLAPSSSLCGSCHDIVVPKELSGAAEDVHLERTFFEWSTSLFSETGSQPLSCGRCHMRTESNVPVAVAPNADKRPLRRLHTFPGVDVALTEFPERENQLDAVQRFLDTSLRFEICVSHLGDMNVVLESLAPGHNFPSGASQDRRVWVEVRGYDREGNLQFEHGVPPAGTPVAEVSDAWVLRDKGLKLNGEPAHMFWDIAEPVRQTIPAPITRDLMVEGYGREISRGRFKVPAAFGTARITVLARVQPIGLEVLDDLVRTAHLDPSIRDAMPTFDMLPNRRSNGEAVSLTWTYEKAQAEGYAPGDYVCVESARHAR
jgi:hypothetical protein